MFFFWRSNFKNGTCSILWSICFNERVRTCLHCKWINQIQTKHISTSILTWLRTEAKQGIYISPWGIKFNRVCERHKMLLLQLHSGVTPRHQMIKTCQEHFEKLLHVLWQPLDWVRICKRSFKLEAKWRKGHTVALTWVTSFSDHLQRPGATHASGERAEKSEEPYFLFMFISGKSFFQSSP